MTDKTPLGKLIEIWESQMNEVPDEYGYLRGCYKLFIVEAKAFLPEEKQAIVDAYQAGWEVGDGDTDSSNNGEDYFTQKYKA